MSPLREMAYAKIDSLNEAQLQFVLQMNDGLKSMEQSAQSSHVTGEEAWRAFEAMRCKTSATQEMTLDEINEEIRLTREEMRQKKRHELGQKLIEQMREYSQTAPEMTLDEINEEIRLAREEMKAREKRAAEQRLIESKCDSACMASGM